MKKLALKKKSGDFDPSSIVTTLDESGLSSRDRKKIKRLNLLIYGPPKRGKTIAAHAMPRTRTLDFDDGMQSVEWAIKAGMLNRRMEDVVYATVKPKDPLNDRENNTLDIASKVLDHWLKEEDIPDDEWDKPYDKHWDTLIIDSATEVTEASIILGLKENSRLDISKSWASITSGLSARAMRRQDWGTAALLFKKFIHVCQNSGKNLVVIAHEYHNTTEEGTLISIDPMVIGQLRQSLPGMFDEVWYAKVKGSKDKASFLFQTLPDHYRNLGSRLGCLDAEEPADFNEIKKKVCKFYGVDESLVWTAAYGSAARAAEVQETIDELEDNMI